MSAAEILMATPTVEELMGEPPVEHDDDDADIDAEFEIEIRRKKRRRGHEKEKEEPDLVIEKRTDIYRETRIGRALISSLNQLKSENKIQGNLAEVVLQQFDRLLDDRWMFKLKDVIFSEAHKELAQVDSCTILASLARDITI